MQQSRPRHIRCDAEDDDAVRTALRFCGTLASLLAGLEPCEPAHLRRVAEMMAEGCDCPLEIAQPNETGYQNGEHMTTEAPSR